MKPIKKILMDRDCMTESEAEYLIEQAQDDLIERINSGEFVDDAEFCAEWFGLEPDYIIELIPV